MFNLDTASAVAFDKKAGDDKITESGKYVGIINYAYTEKTASGAEMVYFSFTDEQRGQSVKFGICTRKKDGERSFGMDTMNAILCCAKQRTATPTPIMVKAWDTNAQAETDQKKDGGLKELMGVKIGFLFQKVMENYISKDGTVKDITKVELFSVFDAENEWTASEILSKKSSGRVEKAVDYLAQNILKDKRKNLQGTASPSPVHSFSSKKLDEDFADDIPF